MKIFVVICMICNVSVINAQFLLRPNLPMGEYKLIFKGIVRCDSRQKNEIQLNLYLSKKSVNTTEIKGNITGSIDFNDSLTLEMNMAIKDFIGGWKDNAYVYRSPNGCSQFKQMLGKSWSTFISGMNIHETNCPIRKGNYNSNGFETENIFLESNLPKVFFYGLYKMRLYFAQNRKVLGCIIFILDIKRPWEFD